MPYNVAILFRGVSCEAFLDGTGLSPKKSGQFSYSARSGEVRSGQGWRSGTGAGNAVLKHQLRQEGYPTSGVSTTPLYERALFYATRGGTTSGYIYKIDREQLHLLGVREFVVSDIIPFSSVPEDQEVILFAKDGTSLPTNVVLDVQKVPT